MMIVMMTIVRWMDDIKKDITMTREERLSRVDDGAGSC